MAVGVHPAHRPEGDIMTGTPTSMCVLLPACPAALVGALLSALLFTCTGPSAGFHLYWQHE